MRKLLIYLAQKLTGRPVCLDPQVPLSVIAGRAVSIVTGVARGLILTRRKVILNRGARVIAPSALHLRGGLTRLEANCLVDCTSHDGISLGRNFKLGACSRMIASGSWSDLGKGIRVGDNVGIGEFAYIGGAGGVEIGSDTIVGQYFSVHPENHIFDAPDCPIRAQGVTRAGIKIGAGCWIGAKVTVLDGVTLGDRCVIAAGAVVTTSFPAGAVIGGVPARLLRGVTAKEAS